MKSSALNVDFDSLIKFRPPYRFKESPVRIHQISATVDGADSSVARNLIYVGINVN